MRVLVVLLAALALTQADPVKYKLGFPGFPDLSQISSKANTRVLEDYMSGIIYCVLDVFVNGWPEQNIPVFDPFRQVDPITISLDIPGIISGTLSTSNGTSTGLATTEISNIIGYVGLIPPRFELYAQLTTQNLSVALSYDGSGQILEEDIWGTGDLHVQLNGIVISVNATLTLSAQITGVSVIVGLDELAQLELTGYKDSADLSQEIVDFIVNNTSEIVQELNSLISQVIDALLNGEGGGDDDAGDGGVIGAILTRCVLD